MWCALTTVLLSGLLFVEGGLLYASAPQNRGQYFRGQSAGGYNYGYNTGEGVAKVEVKREDGSVVGSYRYFDPNGKQIVRSYIADSKGFRILGNDLPINPETPAAALVGAPALTASVEGAHQQVVDAAQSPYKPLNTVDIRNIVAPSQSNYNTPYQATFQAPYQVPSPVTYRANNQPEQEAADSNNYYYFPYQYNYDFPAGFAYPTVLGAPKPLPTVVGIQRNARKEANTIPVGGTKSKDYRKSPFSIEGFRPVVVRPSYVVGKRY